MPKCDASLFPIRGTLQERVAQQLVDILYDCTCPNIPFSCLILNISSPCSHNSHRRASVQLLTVARCSRHAWHTSSLSAAQASQLTRQRSRLSGGNIALQPNTSPAKQPQDSGAEEANGDEVSLRYTAVSDSGQPWKQSEQMGDSFERFATPLPPEFCDTNHDLTAK